MMNLIFCSQFDVKLEQHGLCNYIVATYEEVAASAVAVHTTLWQSLIRAAFPLFATMP